MNTTWTRARYHFLRRSHRLILRVGLLSCDNAVAESLRVWREARQLTNRWLPWESKYGAEVKRWDKASKRWVFNVRRTVAPLP